MSGAAMVGASLIDAIHGQPVVTDKIGAPMNTPVITVCSIEKF